MSKKEKTEEEIEISNDVDKYASLEILAESDGGAILLEGLKSDISSAVETLTSGYKKLSHIEMIAVIADMESKINMFKILTRSTKNKKLAKEALELLLK